MSQYVDLDVLEDIEVTDLDNEVTTVGELIDKLNDEDKMELVKKLTLDLPTE
jgi:hypothetical protein